MDTKNGWKCNNNKKCKNRCNFLASGAYRRRKTDNARKKKVLTKITDEKHKDMRKDIDMGIKL